jgi:hypothetical protein
MSRRTKLTDKAAELMEPGEQIELTTVARLGSVAAKVAKSVASGGLVGAAVSGLFGGGTGFDSYKGDVHVVLTDRQLLVFSASRTTGGPEKHLASIRRALLTSTDPKGGLFMKLTIGVEGMSQPVTFTFAPMPPSLRSQARKLAAALPRPTSTA